MDFSLNDLNRFFQRLPIFVERVDRPNDRAPGPVTVGIILVARNLGLVLKRIPRVSFGKHDDISMLIMAIKPTDDGAVGQLRYGGRNPAPVVIGIVSKR